MTDEATTETTAQVEATPTVDWKAAVPSSVQEWDEFKNSDTPEKFYSQIENMRSMIGRSIRPPGEDASAEVKQAFRDKLASEYDLISKPDFTDESSASEFYKRMGRPDEPTGYQLPEAEGMDRSMFEAYMSKAHELGMSQRQFEGMVQHSMGRQSEMMSQQQAQVQEGIAKLKGEWGTAFEGRINQIGNLLEQTSAPEAMKNAYQSGQLPADAIAWLQSMASGMGAEPSVIARTDGAAGGLTKAEARARANEMLDNRELPLHNKFHPEYQASLEKYTKLMEQAY